MGKSRKENTLVDNEKKEKCITTDRTKTQNKEENTNNQVSQVKRPVKRKILNCNTRQRNKKVHGRRDFVDRIEQDAEEAASKEDMGSISQNMVRSIVDVTFA